MLQAVGAPGQAQGHRDPMNLSLSARERQAELGALDPKPCAELVSKPYRLVRVVDERGEVWIEPKTGHEETPEP